MECSWCIRSVKPSRISIRISFSTFVSFIVLFTVTSFSVTLIPISRVFKIVFVFVFFSLLSSWWCWSFLENTICVHQLRKLDEMLKNWILIHVLRKLNRSYLWLIWEYLSINLAKASKWVNWSSFSLRCLKEVFSSWIKSLIWIFSWSTSSSATCWWITKLSIRSLGVLLLHMGVQSWIWKISLITVFAFEVSSSIIIFWSSLSTLLVIAILILAALLWTRFLWFVLVLIMLIWVILIHCMSSFFD